MRSNAPSQRSLYSLPSFHTAMLYPRYEAFYIHSDNPSFGLAWGLRAAGTAATAALI
jgi:hypothetical protein